MLDQFSKTLGPSKSLLFVKPAHDETDDCLENKTRNLFQPIISPITLSPTRNLTLTIVYLAPK